MKFSKGVIDNAIVAVASLEELMTNYNYVSIEYNWHRINSNWMGRKNHKSDEFLCIVYADLDGVPWDGFKKHEGHNTISVMTSVFSSIKNINDFDNVVRETSICFFIGRLPYGRGYVEANFQDFESSTDYSQSVLQGSFWKVSFYPNNYEYFYRCSSSLEAAFTSLANKFFLEA